MGARATGTLMRHAKGKTLPITKCAKGVCKPTLSAALVPIAGRALQLSPADLSAKRAAVDIAAITA
jgi:hypothetical protein